MGGHQPGVWIPDSRKGELDKLLEDVKSVEKSKGNCLFVIDEKGRTCGNPVKNNCHVIPEASVLGELKDSDSGKVLELRWGVSRWQHHLVSGNKGNPINRNVSDSFDPQSVGTGDACVGWFACKDEAKHMDHDGEFCPIDVKEPDLKDPVVGFLYIYRAALYDVDMCRLGKKFVEGWNIQALRHHDIGTRVEWLQMRNSLRYRTPNALAFASRLGKIWYRRNTHGVLDADIVSEQPLYFQSGLKFAFTGFYRTGAVVTVVPVGEYKHKMGVFHLSENADLVKGDKERLIQLTSDSEAQRDHGVEILEDLVTYGRGAIAASPESYHGLRDADKRTIRSLVARDSSADAMVRSFSPPRLLPPRTVRRR